MKILNGSELASYIKERQVKQVRALKQSQGITPHLAIIRTNPDPVVDSYMKLKKAYGSEIGVEVEVHTIDQQDALEKIAELNGDESVHGIIVQIPLPDPSQTTEILDAVALEKDVDGLAHGSKFDPPTPIAINWLLAGYNIQLDKGKQVLVVGTGRLVGAPLARLWQHSDLQIQVANKLTENLEDLTRQADVIVTATGQPGLITADMIKPNVVIVDAGVATDSNGLIGDVDPTVRDLPDITITPEKGGVGPLTVCALFENVIRATSNVQ